MIRHVLPQDHRAIAELVTAAFKGPAEAILVERLRDEGDAMFELVVEEGGRIAGHILFSRLWAESRHLYAALAPLAVRPDRQGAGLGGELTRRGLETAREFGAHAVIVLGDPRYYPRFGFSAKAASRLAAPYSGSPAFMALELEPGALADPLAIAYPDAFG